MLEIYNEAVCTKVIKNASGALLSYVERSAEKQDRAEGECFSHFSSVLKNSELLMEQGFFLFVFLHELCLPFATCRYGIY